MVDSLRRAEMVRRWRKWAVKIARAYRKRLPDAKIYVLGSVARGEAIAASDVDLLVASELAPKTPRKIAELKVEIEEELGLPPYHPFEIHLTRPEEAREFLGRTRGPVLEL